ncbi:AAA family ATPase, partial [Conexibacter sp. JD483]
MSGSLIGRVAELEALARFLAALEQGSAALVLDGEPGSGKSALLDAAADAAAKREVRVLRWEGATGEPAPAERSPAARGAGEEPGAREEAGAREKAGARGEPGAREKPGTREQLAEPVPYGALAALVAQLDPALTQALPAPQRAALAQALAGEAVDQRLIGTATRTLIGVLTRARPLALALDGAERLDRPSALVLEFCARRLPAGAGLLLTRLPGGAGEGDRLALAALRGTDHAERHRLGPLGAGELERL